MSEAKKKVLAMISKRQAKNKSYKDKAAQRLGPRGIVLQFIEAMGKVTSEAKGALDFQTGLERESLVLLQRMRSLDPDVEVSIIWNREDKVEHWQDLQVEGVEISWSKWYQRKNPYASDKKLIDVGTLFLEGYLGEEE